MRRSKIFTTSIFPSKNLRCSRLLLQRNLDTSSFTFNVVRFLCLEEETFGAIRTSESNRALSQKRRVFPMGIAQSWQFPSGHSSRLHQGSRTLSISLIEIPVVTVLNDSPLATLQVENLVPGITLEKCVRYNLSTSSQRISVSISRSL